MTLKVALPMDSLKHLRMFIYSMFFHVSCSFGKIMFFFPMVYNHTMHRVSNEGMQKLKNKLSFLENSPPNTFLLLSSIKTSILMGRKWLSGCMACIINKYGMIKGVSRKTYLVFCVGCILLFILRVLLG